MKLMKNYHKVLLFLGWTAACCAAQDFSADVIYRNVTTGTKSSADPTAESHHPAKLYVSNAKLRLETRSADGVVLIVNEEAFALYPVKKEYQPMSGGVSQYFRVTDVENACADWQKAAMVEFRCEKAGEETVNGRHTVRYKNANASDGTTAEVWIDAHLKFVVKWASSTTEAELENINEAHQADDLFTMPPDYEIAKPRKGNNKGFTNH